MCRILISWGRPACGPPLSLVGGTSCGNYRIRRATRLAWIYVTPGSAALGKGYIRKRFLIGNVVGVHAVSDPCDRGARKSGSGGILARRGHTAKHAGNSA